MSERLPRLFGKYVLLKSLARGGMGEIYLAASDQPGGLSKLCVIKKIIAEKTDRAKVNRFLDEAKVVLRLSHANLVSTFDAGDAAGELFIAMELVEGKDLREIWNRCVRTRTRIPLDVALYVVRETARALAYVHTYGELRLVHRDVAPPNILLSYYGEVKLTDFGLARSAIKQEHTAPGVVFGRASYLAPEQARGEVADARTDVYSLGIVLWELLTGQPYLQLAGLDPVTSLSLVRNPKTQPPSSQARWISPELDAIVLRALAADRTKRYQSAEELRRALSEVMAHVAPRADAERVAEFLRTLYQGVRTDEAAERERMLTETLPTFRGERRNPSETPRTGVLPSPNGTARQSSGGIRIEPPPSSVDDEASASSPIQDTVVARVAEPSSESLHASAMRARADSSVRKRSADGSGADVDTTVWRRNKTAPDRSGQTFVGLVIDNRYRIRRRIGEGGMGTVYAAEHVDIGKSVAVKILRRQFSGDKQLVERFRREARAASRVGHPHIIDVTDFGTTEDGCAYFVMEHLEGLDLADVLAREGPLDSARATRIAIQICQALRAAHHAGIIHRDLKPENVFLVSRDGQADFAKVLDFGIARNLSPEASRLTNPGMTMGTPEYMAPEQVMGRPADSRTDIYALGALIYEMVIGAAPFHTATDETMLDQKMRPLPSLRIERPDIPLALDAIVAAAMAPDASHRPQTMAALEYELTKIVAGRPQAVAELVGLREFTVPQVETPAAEVSVPPPRSAAPMHPDDLEALLEKDLSPPPVLTAAVPGKRPSGSSRPIAVAPPNGVWDEPVPAPGSELSPERARRNRWVAGAMLAVGVVVGGVWISRQGPPVARPAVAPSPPLKVLAATAPSHVTPPSPRAPSGAGMPTATLPAPPLAPAAPVRHSVPEIVLTSPVERARAMILAGSPDDAITLLRPALPKGDPAVRALLVDALVASGTKVTSTYNWTLAGKRAREALTLVVPPASSRGAHALLGDVLSVQGDPGGAIAEYQRALLETPRDARLKRHMMRARRLLQPAPAEAAVSAPSEPAAE
ncbi:MAG TPA: protein kinase [Polyangia bacterium]|jgi:serine/threonine-protein kinase